MLSQDTGQAVRLETANSSSRSPVKSQQRDARHLILLNDGFPLHPHYQRGKFIQFSGYHRTKGLLKRRLLNRSLLRALTVSVRSPMFHSNILVCRRGDNTGLCSPGRGPARAAVRGVFQPFWVELSPRRAQHTLTIANL